MFLLSQKYRFYGFTYDIKEISDTLVQKIWEKQVFVWKIWKSHLWNCPYSIWNLVFIQLNPYHLIDIIGYNWNHLKRSNCYKFHKFKIPIIFYCCLQLKLNMNWHLYRLLVLINKQNELNYELKNVFQDGQGECFFNSWQFLGDLLQSWPFCCKLFKKWGGRLTPKPLYLPLWIRPCVALMSFNIWKGDAV